MTAPTTAVPAPDPTAPVAAAPTPAATVTLDPTSPTTPTAGAATSTTTPTTGNGGTGTPTATPAASAPSATQAGTTPAPAAPTPAFVPPDGHTAVTDIPPEVQAAMPDGTQITKSPDGAFVAHVPNEEGTWHQARGGIGADLRALIQDLKALRKRLAALRGDI